MADISKVSIDGGTTELNIKDATARAEVTAIEEKIPSAATSSNKLVDTASMNTALSGKVDTSSVGVSVASLNGTGKVPESQLPSYVDDVIEGYLYEGAFYEDAQHTTPITGESGKIYVDLDTDKTYRWSGTVYVCTGSSLEIGEVTGTAFDGGRGKAIEDKIPSNASSSNKLTTADDVLTVDEKIYAEFFGTVGRYLNNYIPYATSYSDGEYNGATIKTIRYPEGNVISIKGYARSRIELAVHNGLTLPRGKYNLTLYILRGYGKAQPSNIKLFIPGESTPAYMASEDNVVRVNLSEDTTFNVQVDFQKNTFDNLYLPLIYDNTVDNDIEELNTNKQDKITFTFTDGRLTFNNVSEEVTI